MKKLTVQTEITLEERVAMKIAIDELQAEINKLKENPNYPLDVFVELLSVEKKVRNLFKPVYDKYKLDTISYRK